MPEPGVAIVLTADRTLMSDWPLLLDGMAAAAQTTWWPMRLMQWYVARPVGDDGLRARQAPLGLRRVESALRLGGFAPGDVAVVPPARLQRAVGPATRIVGLASGDPLGLGMNSTTLAAVFGGEPITSAEFQALAARARALVERAGARAKVVVGGPGAWQLAQDQPAARRLGIDHVIGGYCESNVAGLARELVSGAALPFELAGVAPQAGEIPPIGGPTVMGMVEVSRGCGWGCRFCTLAGVPMAHLPLETILADVRTNAAGGVRNISLTSEDFFRYGASGAEHARPAAVIQLLARLAAMPGVATLAVDHANASTVARFSDAELAEVRRLLSLGRADWRPWVNVGVETAAGALLAASGGSPKMRPFGPDLWPEAASEQVRRLSGAGFLPMVSLVIGLPGETAGDLALTSDWVAQLKGLPVAVVPVLYAPVRAPMLKLHRGRAGEGGAAGTAGVAAVQWELFKRSMDMTFDSMPRLYWQHWRAAAVGLGRRLALQVLGRGYEWMWRCALWRKARAPMLEPASPAGAQHRGRAARP